MPSTLNGQRYYSLLLSGGITPSELETELSGSAAKKGNFLSLCQNRRLLKSLLNFGYSTIRESASALAQVLTRGYVLGSSSVAQGLIYSSESYSPLGLPQSFSSRGSMLSAIKYSSAFVSKNDATNSSIYVFDFFTNVWYLITATGVGNVKSGSFTNFENGYTFGGDTSGGGAYTDTIDKTNYASKATTTLTATLVDTRQAPAGVSSSVNGYACGGADAGRKTEIDGLTFASEAAYNPSVALGTATDNIAGGESSTKGYLFGGSTGSAVNTTQALVFSSETIGAIASTLSTARQSIGTTQYGAGNYLFGGTGDASRLTRFPHATETLADVNNTLTSYNASNSQAAGFHGGGI